MTLEQSERPIFSGSLWTRLFRNQIQCTLWEIPDNGQPKFIARKKVRYGKPFFYWKKNRYNIDYKTIRHGKKSFEFDCDVNNSTGGLTFHKNVNEHVTPNQSGSMLKQGLVDFFIERGGMPFWWLLVAVVAIGIVGGSLGILLIDTMPYKEEYLKLEPLYNTLVKENADLRSQLGVAIG